MAGAGGEYRLELRAAALELLGGWVRGNQLGQHSKCTPICCPRHQMFSPPPTENFRLPSQHALAAWLQHRALQDPNNRALSSDVAMLPSLLQVPNKPHPHVHSCFLWAPPLVAHSPVGAC